jgi:Flp pilus assembly pilin Flp
MMRIFARLISNDDAATAVEYAVMLALILMVAIVGIAALGQSNGGGWMNIDNSLEGVGFGGS